MESLIIALSMYSRLPVKDIEWNDRNMKMAFAWFPLIGVIIGIFETINCNAASRHDRTEPRS